MGSRMWIVAGLAGIAVVASGLLSAHAAWQVIGQVGPVLLFLLGITVVAELADAAGVFAAAADLAARLGGGSVRRLFALVLALGTLTTLVLSLDTTAVLLTPVVLVLAARLRIAAAPFAMATVWLANTASLLLPVSNLTNLLAMRGLGLTVTGFAARMWLPAVAALAVTVLVLSLRYRTQLGGRYEAPEREAIEDVVLFRAAAGVCLAVGPLFVAGLNVAVVACCGAAVLGGLFAVRRRGVLRFSLLPWRLVIMVSGLFLVIGAWQQHGLERLLDDVVGTGTALPDLARLAAVSAGFSNVANNLPAFAALHPVAGSSVPRVLALLIGTNLGPLILLWGSLATLLWRERCSAKGVRISAREFAMVGLIGVPVLLAASTLGLVVTTR
jgi:arsenical pump membrane protein